MRALIIGCGFIGKNLCEYLKKLDIEFDVIGRDWYSAFTGKGDYNLVFYLAGEVRNPADMFEANVRLLYRALTNSLDWNCVFVYVGSSSEYGRMDRPMRESDPISPTNLYDATKGMGTLLCQGFAKEFGRPIVILRPSSLYGKYERQEKFIPTVIRKIKAYEPVDVYPGVHDWLHVNDFISAMFTVILDGNLNGEIYNVSSGIQIYNTEVVMMVRRVMQIFKPMPKIHAEKFHPHDTDNWTVDNSKIKELGWRPRYNLAAGLGKTVTDILAEDK
jgi:nucleoside-diphosphate-sugar epimerase